MQFILYLKVENFHNQETVCVFSTGKMCPQMLLKHFVVWVSLGHSSLDSTGEHGWPESSFRNFCPSVQDKAELLRLHKNGTSTQLSTWQLAPFRDRQGKPLDQS